MKIAELANCQNDTEGILADINVSFKTNMSCLCAVNNLEGSREVLSSS
jgi:hypothetical protein